MTGAVEYEPADERVLRVFVSSTFRDMQRERDELVKRVFPQIRAMCARRGVQWSEIDLRWGVTDEQKAEGAVLPICLAEIDRTRPYFIGMIGQRYGWVPDEVPPDLVDRLGWLADDLGRSVTELEILHGVLREREGAPDGHAFFYLRDPAWLDTLDDDELADHVEASDDGRRRLAELRERIRASGHPTSDYGDPIELGRKVLADLTALVDERFPVDEAPDAAERAAAVHRSFGRARFGLHVDREIPVVDELDRYLSSGLEDGSSAPLVVTGTTGVGVSSLVTNWAWGHDGRAVLLHHVGADAEAADHRSMVARVLAWLDPSRSFDDHLVELGAAPPPQLRAALSQAFATVSSPVLIVLDGVDRLTDVDGAPDLSWLPDETTETVRIVLTSTGDRPVAAASRRRWRVVSVPELAHQERVEIARVVLAASSKALDRVHLDALVAGRFAGNARFLRIVLDELRQHGDHFTLRPLIDRLIAVDSVDDLLELVLERYERDFDRDRPGLTRDVMTAVWAARQGLAEGELLDLLGGFDEHGGHDPLPQAIWAPLHLAVEQSLVSRGGLLGFADPEMVRAVEDRYLAGPGARAEAHAQLAAFFERRPMSDRVADELGWQQADSGDVDALERTLGDLEYLERLAVRHPTDPRRLWARLGLDPATAEARMLSAYRAVVDEPAAFLAIGASDEGDDGRRQLVWAVTRLLADAGELPSAMRLGAHLVDVARDATRRRPDDPIEAARLRAALVNHSVTSLQVGDLEGADAALVEALASAEEHGDRQHLADAVMNLGMVRRDLDRRREAAELLSRAVEAYRELDDRRGLQAALGNIAELHRMNGDNDAAIAALIEQERICRDLADSMAVARALLGQAVALADRGDVADGLDAMEAGAAICRDEGDLVGLVGALINVTTTAEQAGQLDRSMEASVEGEAAARTLGDPSLLVRVLAARASLLGRLQRWAESADVALEAESIAGDAGLTRQRALALGALGTARRELGDLIGARRAHDTEHAIAREIGEPSFLGAALFNLGNVDAAQQDWDAAIGRYEAASAIFVELDTPTSILPAAANLGQIHLMAQRLPQALEQFIVAGEAAARIGVVDVATQWTQRAMQVAQQLGDPEGMARSWEVMAAIARRSGDEALLQQALGDRAGLLIAQAQQEAARRGRPDDVSAAVLDEVEPLLIEQHALCSRSGNDAGLASCLGNLAVVNRYRGDIEQALRHVDEQRALSQRTSNAQGVLLATANRGELLGLLGRTDEARAELGQARAIAQQYGMAPMVHQLDQMIASLG